jgi:hypothetical protein
MMYKTSVLDATTIIQMFQTGVYLELRVVSPDCKVSGTGQRSSAGAVRETHAKKSPEEQFDNWR